jgi:hypothetical protein
LAQDRRNVAALRAARLASSTALITRDQFGGWRERRARAGAHARPGRAADPRGQAAPRYGIAGGEPSLDYVRLLARVRT